MAEDRIEKLLSELTLDEKVSLTVGDDVWHLPAVERLGIGRLKMSDGPSGVRGERIGVKRSMSFPCGMASGATWDVGLIERYGSALAAEAISKGVHLLLGPTVCIPRTPLGGRTFESFSEDPWLSSRLTVAYVRGVQDGGVGCCVKHFACNDQEHERMSIDVDIDERTLREVHLAPFESAVAEAGVWSLMGAYNRVQGDFCCEHPRLLGEILKGEWGFDGVVVSDWFGTHSTAAAAIAGLDVEMPGPGSWFGRPLAEAVQAGEVDEGIVDDHVRRVLRLAERTGALDAPPVAEGEDDDPGRRTIARELAIGGTVMLDNDGLLPLDPATVRRVVVIGPNAVSLATGGGGSSRVSPHRRLSFVDELATRLGGVEITHEIGCRLDRGAGRLDPRLIPAGLALECFRGTSWEGNPVGSETVRVGSWTALGDPYPGVPVNDCSVRVGGVLRPDATGTWTIGLASIGGARLSIDGALLIDNMDPTPGDFFYGMGSETVHQAVDLVAGSDHQLVVEYTSGAHSGVAGFEVFASRPPDPDAMDRAVAAAADADAAIVVVGSNDQWETEGADRTGLRLVGEQDELVERVLAANPRTAVVLNAGGPIETPWADRAAAVLMTWYPGEEGAPALADIVSGVAEPSGRLPITFPRRLEDNPTHGAYYPGSGGVVRYGEGMFVGYRHYDASGISPAYPFGHGLGYTTFEFGSATADVDGTDVVVTVPVTNTGRRRGSAVVQLYVADVESSVPRPAKELKAFDKTSLDAGETTSVTLTLDERSFAYWDEAAGGWTVEPGEFDLVIGASSADVRATVRVAIGA
jgi:beta-glucosidase